MSGIQHPQWRDGLQRLFAVEAPDPGHEWAFQLPQVPEAVWFRIKSIIFQLTASAAVGNRFPRLAVDTGLNGMVYYVSANGAAQVAGTVFDHSFAESAGLAGAAGGGSIATAPARNLSCVGMDLRFPSGHRIRSETGGFFDVADQYANIRLLLQELIYVPPVDYITGAVDEATQRIVRAVKESGTRCGLIEGPPIGSPT